VLLNQIRSELKTYIEDGKAEHSYGFFKAMPGGYGEGDQFWGVSVPSQRKVAKKFKQVGLDDLVAVIQSPYHEERLTALFILNDLFKKGNNKQKKQCFDFYLQQINYVNNWDLVDSSAHKIVGLWLLDKDRSLLYKLAKSNNLWERRIAMISCYAFIKNEDYDDVLKLALILLNDKHDLIHKVVGWMLKELGKKEKQRAWQFLQQHYAKMPRTMLRVAIEKFAPDERQDFLKGKL
jgi:3-methyladenine DNA glycosylase AlkD